MQLRRTLRRARGGLARRRGLTRGVLAFSCAVVWLSALTVLVASGSTVGARAAAAPSTATRPDIIVFLTDDMRYDELAHLPKVRRWLIDRGATFTHAISADSICCPARATLLTGKDAHNHRTIGNSEGTYGGADYFYRYNDTHDLLPSWLQGNGYRTGWMGKLLNGRRGLTPDPDWNYWNVPVRGIYHYDTGWTTSINGTKVTYPPSAYRESQMRQDLLGRVRHWQPKARPYFVLAAHLAPHNSKGDARDRAPVPSRRYRDTVDGSALPTPPATEETDLSDKPPWIADNPRVGGFMRSREARRLEALRSVDDTVGAVARQLARSGDLDHTLMIFTSDNGYVLGEHKYDGKNAIYEESLHIPLVIAGPGFAPGSQVDQMVSLADVTSTIRQAAGVAAQPGEDGLPLQPFAQDATYRPERPVLLEGSTSMVADTSYPVDAIGRFYTGVRWKDYVYAEYEGGQREFYDLTQDPYELDNAYLSPDGPQPPSPVQVRLAAWLAAHKDCVGSAACNEPVPGLSG